MIINKCNNIPMLNDNFLSESIKKDIERFKECYSIKFENINLRLIQKNKNVDKDKIIKILNRIIRLNKLFGDNSVININIWLSDIKKTMPKTDEIFNIDHINSASCQIYQNKNGIINIWRNEELLKVLVHELLHCFHIDYEFFENDIIHNKIEYIIKKKYKIYENININESYIECLASYFNILFYIEENGGKFDELYKKELNFSLNQTYKILDHYLINDFKNFSKFKQKTSVFSYYIVKTALFNNLSNFLKFIKKYGIKMEKINIPKYLLLIDESLNKMVKKNGKYTKTLRMTIIE